MISIKLLFMIILVVYYITIIIIILAVLLGLPFFQGNSTPKNKNTRLIVAIYIYI